VGEFDHFGDINIGKAPVCLQGSKDFSVEVIEFDHLQNLISKGGGS
jgi:hypothetical protein